MTPADLVALKQQLTAHEGRKSYLYDDATGLRIAKGVHVVGHPTWGIGFNTDTTPFCDAAIDAQYEWVLANLIQDMTHALPWAVGLPSGPWRALLDIRFNAGLDGLLTFTKMLAFVEAGDYPRAAEEIIRSALAPRRKQQVAALMTS